MKSTALSLVLGVAALGLVGPSALAQQSSTSAVQNPLGNVERVDKVDGKSIMTSDNQKDGKIKDLVLDLQSGHILYVVVSGTGKGTVAVSPQIFTQTPAANDEYAHVNVDKAKLDGAPQFTSQWDKVPNIGSAQLLDAVTTYFGQSRWWQGHNPANQGNFAIANKDTAFLGKKVENVNNAPVGKINNIVVDLPRGRILYVVLEPDSSLNLGDNLYALPPDAITWNAGQKSLVSNIDQSKLASAPHFASNNWPNLSDPSFASQVYQYYGKQAYFQGGGLQPTGR